MSRVLSPAVPASDFHGLFDPMSAKPLVPSAVGPLQVLADIFDDEWIANFLLTTDPVHLPYLNSPEMENTALMCDLRVAYMNPAMQQTTLGVGVMESSEIMNTQQPGRKVESPVHRYTMRFVRNSKRRSTLAVMDDVDEGIVVMHYSITDSHLCPYTLEAKFHRRDLFSDSHEGRNQLTLKTLQSSLFQYNHTSQLRSCLHCHAPPASGCICYDNTLRLPRHPFDAENFKLSLSKDFGNYQGLSNKIVTLENQSLNHIFFGAHSSFQPVDDLPALHRMSNWALTQLCRGLTETAKPSLQFTMTERKEVPELDTRGRNWLNISESHEGRTCSGKEVREQLFDRISDFSREPLNHHVSVSTTRDGDSFAQEPEVERDNVAKCGEEGAEFQHNIKLSIASTPCNVDSGRQPIVIDTQYREELAEIFAQREGPERHQRTVVEDSDMEIEREQCMSSSGSLSPIEDGRISKKGNCSQARSIAKELQAARRRLQNRASAHRSNMKKKAFINDMKEKLWHSKERIEELREKEMRLRVENLRLRKEVEKR